MASLATSASPTTSGGCTSSSTIVPVLPFGAGVRPLRIFRHVGIEYGGLPVRIWIFKLSVPQRDLRRTAPLFADRHHIAVVQQRLIDRGTVDESAVDAVGVVDFGTRRRRHQRRVVAGGQQVGDHDVVGGPADADRSRRRLGGPAGPDGSCAYRSRYRCRVRRGAGPTAVGCELAGCGTLDTADVGGCPADPSCPPNSNVSSGPTRLPTLMSWPSSRSMAGTRRPWT